MKLLFKYDLQKDAENLVKSFKSINSSERSELEIEYLKQYKEVNERDAASFLTSPRTNIADRLNEISSKWQKIEDESIKRMEAIFGESIVLPTSFLSTNARCTYSTEGNYFFVHMLSSHTNKTILHELCHFYTHHAFKAKLDAQGASREEYNDIKESLTMLLNTDFKDLLDQSDVGYPQHQEMRIEIQKLREEGKSVEEIVAVIARRKQISSLE
jgi:hypothetical protein